MSGSRERDSTEKDGSGSDSDYSDVIGHGVRRHQSWTGAQDQRGKNIKEGGSAFRLRTRTWDPRGRRGGALPTSLVRSRPHSLPVVYVPIGKLDLEDPTPTSQTSPSVPVDTGGTPIKDLKPDSTGCLPPNSRLGCVSGPEQHRHRSGGPRRNLLFDEPLRQVRNW